MLGSLVRDAVSRGLHATGFCNRVAKLVDVREHVVEVLGRALKFCAIIFAMKDVHRVLDGMEVIEKL
jgi:hypothetical protein